MGGPVTEYGSGVVELGTEQTADMADEQLGLGFPLPEEPKKQSGGAVPPRPLGDDETIDYITGRDILRMTEAEKVRQHIARVLVHQYGISPDDMMRDYVIEIPAAEGNRKSRKKVSIAVFEPGKPHRPEHLRRIVITKPRPKTGRTVTKIRTHEQATNDIDELQSLMTVAGPQCHLGLWTDDIDLYFVERLRKDDEGRELRFEDRFRPLPNWPRGDDTAFDAARDASSLAEIRRADKYMLRFAFRRCHNYIHGNEGLPKDAAFWQFLYVLFAKIYDERMVREEGKDPRFRIEIKDLVRTETTAGGARRRAGSPEVAARVKALFDEVKEFYKKQGLFDQRDELTLSVPALTFIVGELAPYDLGTTDIDAKGVAYQELVGDNLRGDRGQYFTPNEAVKLVVDILDPQAHETVFDPCCGTGGFLRETLNHLLRKWQKKENGTFTSAQDLVRQMADYRRRLAAYAEEHLFGADFDPFLRRATMMSLMTLTDTAGHAFQMDSLAFPDGHLPGNDEAYGFPQIRLGAVDVLMTNPPFGSDIPVSEDMILKTFRDRGGDFGVAYNWTKNREGELTREKPATAVSPERLFVQRAVEWVRPGGRIGIVLPNGILSNPGPADEAVRRFILDQCWVLASVELPVETFIAEANVNILTTLLFLRRKTRQERQEEMEYGNVDYPVFMAVAEKVGVDRRGNKVFVRTPDGEVVTEEEVEREILRIGGVEVPREIRRRVQKIDNDLPKIAEAYHEFEAEHRHEFPWNTSA
ncbi:methylation-associated defense system DNA methyltransferase MAD2 [Streptomyces beigongshangae]|uniref:methylation-associated defense system DNA methyltransferase MAD2 n=1 Tax=Streptomyces beigongshangae TaxID=2841597 RepID=UPI001C85C362|nr:N-6 DNA methylase [Streptomyces sp. REN17]